MWHFAIKLWLKNDLVKIKQNEKKKNHNRWHVYKTSKNFGWTEMRFLISLASIANSQLANDCESLFLVFVGIFLVHMLSVRLFVCLEFPTLISISMKKKKRHAINYQVASANKFQSNERWSISKINKANQISSKWMESLLFFPLRRRMVAISS